MSEGGRSLRGLLVAVGVGLIALGLASLLGVPLPTIRTPDRPWGTAEDLATLAQRDDLNVVFILIDTLRADRLSAYGYARPTSPVMDALAASGIRFARTLAQSTWTKSSMASLWTGTYPVTNRITRYPHGLSESATAPAEILRDAGLRTVGIWRNGWVAPNFGFGQGFDLYFRPRANPMPGHVLQRNPSSRTLPGTDYDLTEAAVEFLRSVGDGRFFLYLHLMDVHQYVYDDSADFGSTYSDIYDNAIRWVDANVGTLVAVMQERGLMKRSVLVIASDHGEAFLEHGTEGHARNLYVETTHVPLLVVLPFRLREGIVVESPVENVDIWPTILDLLGLDPLPAAQGRSLVPLVEAAARGGEDVEAERRRPRFAHLDRTWGRTDTPPQPLISVSRDGYRLFRNSLTSVELYDLRADPLETTNLASREPERVADLMGRVAAYLQLPGAAWGAPTEVELTEMEWGQLKALGYMVDPDRPRDEQIVNTRAE